MNKMTTKGNRFIVDFTSAHHYTTSGTARIAPNGVFGLALFGGWCAKMA